jgi:alpha-N-acetylglucosamine transferase
MKKNAFVTFIIRNDSYLPGALVFAYALKLQKTQNDLICIVSDNISEYAINTLKLIYDDVLVIDEVYVPHERRHERQDRPFLFSRFNAFRLGPDGDLGKKYEKIIIADCDLLPLYEYDTLFDLHAPAGIINEKKEYCMEYDEMGKYIVPESVFLNSEWIWHKVYADVPHGTMIPKEITDRIKTDKENMGVNASIYLFNPSMKLYNSVMDDLENQEVINEISLYNWPEMQYITDKLSGQWTNVDLRFSSFNGYPDIAHIKGIHFAGLKPWSMKNKSVKSFGKFDDYKLWYYTFIKMCNEVDHVIDNRKIKKLYNQISLMLQDEKYLFYKKYIPHLSHFFE